MDTPTIDLESCLHERFGLDQFRPGQREVIETVLAGRDCLCVMPTGSGKSLCYQLPALVQEGVTLVISPLIALMKDQVDGLVERGIRATFINSTIDTAAQGERIAATQRGEYNLVYVAPERFRSGLFNEAIARTRIALLAVDEAHCISEWGHDFRPDYTRLGLARKRLKNPTTIALTATATDHVRRDICEQLELADPQVFITGFDRPNLRYEVTYASTDSAKQEALSGILRQTPGSGIIYCSTRKRCEEVAEFLGEQLKRKCLVYHAGLLPDDRRRAQETFMGGRDLVVAATNAFGMGVDKADIRFVVHYNIPGTVEAYYQEAGRAGRDSRESRCVLLYSPGDRYIQEFFIESEYPAREVVASIYLFLAQQEADPIELTQAEIKERLRLTISEMGVGASLKLLDGAGVLERLRARENKAIIRIDSEVSMVGLLPTQATVQRRVLSALERLVATSRGDETYFNPRQLAHRLELDPTQLFRAIHELCERLPVQYVPPFRGNAVRMIDRSRKPENLGIDFEALEKRKAEEYQKLERMIGFAQNHQCRRRAILRYFGDRSPVQCGNCDNCRTARTKPPPPEVPEAASAATPEVGDQTTEVVRKVLSGIARSKGRFGKTTVAAMLTGSKSQTMQRWKLNQLSTYGLLAAFKQPEVVQIIDNLIAAGWVTQDEVEPFRPVISVNAVGWEVMTGEREAACRWQVPTELLAKIRCAGADRVPPLATGQRKSPATDPATAQATEEKGPIDQGLLQRLREARNRWAAEAGLPPYHVLQNATIEELARAKPRSPNELLAIKGIGPAKVDRYGKRLLGIVGGPPSPARAGPSSTPRPASSKATDFPDQQPGSTVSPPDHFTVARRASEAVDHLPGPTVPLPDPSAGPVPSDAHQQSVHHQPDYYWTWRLLERGFTQMECALIRSLDESTVLEHALAAARDGHPVPLDAFLTLDLIETLAAVAGSARTDSIEALCEKLPDDIGAEHVRLYLLTRELKSNT